MNTIIITSVVLFIVYVVLFIVYRVVKRWRARRPLSEKIINEHLMEEFGTTKEERREEIKAHFARDVGKISMLLDLKEPHRCRVFLERNLMMVEPIEKFSLETAYHLFNEEYINDRNFFLMRVGLFYADGQGLDESHKEYRGKEFKGIHLSSHGMQILSRYIGMTLVQSITHALNQLESAYEEHPDNPIYSELYQKYTNSQKMGGGQFDLEKYAKPGS